MAIVTAYVVLLASSGCGLIIQRISAARVIENLALELLSFCPTLRRIPSTWAGKIVPCKQR